MTRAPHELLETNVREIAKTKGVSFVFLVNHAGISTERLLAIFAGKVEPDLELLFKLAAGLSVPMGQLFVEPQLN